MVPLNKVVGCCYILFAEIDPEWDAFQDGPALEASDDELLGAEIAKGSERRRLHGDILLDDKEYAGYPSSRSAIFDEYREKGSEDEGSPEEAIESESEDISSPASSNAEEHGDGGTITTEGERERNGSIGVESEVAALEQVYLRSGEDDANALSALKERAEKERRKALAVAAQKKIWNCGLEIRILIQRVLQGANRLPQPRGRSAVTLYDPQTDAALQGLTTDATDALGDALAILEAMESANPNVRHVSEASKVAGVKRNRGELSDQDDVQEMEQGSSGIMWERLDSAYKRFSQYRDASIDRWHRKTVLSSGIAARGGLRALNQSVSSQVLALLRDSERAVERTRMPMQQCSVLCSLPEERKPPPRDTEVSTVILIDSFRIQRTKGGRSCIHCRVHFCGRWNVAEADVDS